MESGESPYSLLDAPSQAFVARVLTSARDYVGARVSFLAEMVGPDKFVRAASGDAVASGLAPGTRFPVEDTYCYQLLRGQIPEAIYDARHDPLTCSIPLTDALGIDSYMGVPVLLDDGRVFGTLCCVNFEPSPENCGRDVAFMRFLASMLGHELAGPVRTADSARQRRAALTSLLAAGGPTMVFHAIVSLQTGRVVGMEALARLDSAGLTHPPDLLFRDAWDVGMGPALELAAVRGALWAAHCLPENVFLSVNVSPRTLVHPDLAAMLSQVVGDRLVLEVTEHALVDDYDALAKALAPLRSKGVRVAIDDVGAGYSSLRHVLKIAPDIVKLDVSLVAGIEDDVAKQAMVSGVIAFAEKTGTTTIAEGAETFAQARALLSAGVPYAQGFLYGRPGPLASILERL